MAHLASKAFSQLADLIRALFGADPHKHDGPCYEKLGSLEAPPTPPSIARPLQPYHGMSVPVDSSVDPLDSQHIYDDFDERCYFTVAKGGNNVLLWPTTSESENSAGEVIYDDYWRDDDGDSPQERIANAVRIYEHLSASGPLHPRLVQYEAKTPSGLRLARLRPGPIPWDLPRADSSDIILALYQRWAMQVLSALVFLHERGVVLDAVSHDSLWLREDFSVAVSCLVHAGCAAIQIDGDGSGCLYIDPPSNVFRGDWDAESEKCTPRAVHVKGDLFSWATLVFYLMTGREHPLERGLDTKREDDSREAMRREQAVENGRFHA